MKTSSLDENLDFSFGFGLSNYKTASDAVKQSLAVRLQIQRREWFLNVQSNIDWVNLIGRRGQDAKLRIENEIKRVTLETEGVAKIESLTLKENFNLRKFSYTLVVKDIYDQTFTVEG